jgi:hypothetical protein
MADEMFAEAAGWIASIWSPPLPYCSCARGPAARVGWGRRWWLLANIVPPRASGPQIISSHAAQP